MAEDLIVPTVGESITEAQIASWLVKVGEFVEKDEPVVEIETDKVNVEVPAPVSGVLVEVLKEEGDFATVGEVIAKLDPSAKGESSTPKADAPAAKEEAPAPTPEPEPAPTAAAPAESKVMPAAEKAAHAAGVNAANVQGSGPGGRVLKEDVKKASAPAPAPAPKPQVPVAPWEPTEDEEVVPMSPIRRRIAQRLVEAQQNAAMLTTFNEVDMSAVMALRKQHQDSFIEKNGVKLGFMSFFVKAAVDALQAFPNVNAQIHGNDIIYKRYQNIGVAIGGGKGLVVPIIRNAENLGFADVEKAIIDYATKAKNNKLGISDMEGGTFTISNGGIYGSMLSTPILNPPQSAILGLHNITKRAVVVGDEIVIRPMMYLALTYDHRIVDGREAVTFLRRIKEVIETPARLMLNA